MVETLRYTLALAGLVLAMSCATANARFQGLSVPDAQVGTQQASDALERQPSPGQSGEADDAVTRAVRRAATWIDNFLNDERSLEEDNRSSMFLRLDAFAQQHDGIDVAQRIDGRIVLPRTEDRFHLLFGGEPDAADEPPVFQDAAVPAEVVAREPRNPVLALQVSLKQTQSTDIRPEVGLRFHDFDVDPYAGLRWRHSGSAGAWLVRTTERFRAHADAGLESRTIVDLEHGLFDRFFFRASSRGLWREEQPGYAYGQRFTLFQAIGIQTLLAYEWDTSFVSEPEDAIAETLIRCRLSRRFAKNRLLAEVAPQVAWRDADDYASTFGVFVRIELAFGLDDG